MCTNALSGRTNSMPRMCRFLRCPRTNPRKVGAEANRRARGAIEALVAAMMSGGLPSVVKMAVRVAGRLATVVRVIEEMQC